MPPAFRRASGMHLPRAPRSCSLTPALGRETLALQGRQFTKWLADSGAEQGDSVQLQGCGGRLLLLRIAAGEGAGPAPKRRRQAAAAPQGAGQRHPAARGTPGSGQQRPSSSRAAPGPSAQPSNGSTVAEAPASDGSEQQQPLAFEPRCTRRLKAALRQAAQLPPEQALQRVQAPTQRSQHTRWRIWVSEPSCTSHGGRRCCRCCCLSVCLAGFCPAHSKQHPPCTRLPQPAGRCLPAAKMGRIGASWTARPQQWPATWCWCGGATGRAPLGRRWARRRAVFVRDLSC